MKHAHQCATAVVIIHMPPNGDKPFEFIDKTWTYLLPVRSVYQQRARIETPRINRQEQLRSDQGKELSSVHVGVLRYFC
jgi:hypothetical protein